MFHSMKTEETDKSEITKKKIVNLLQKSKEYVWMSSGLNKDFYNDEDVKNTMKDAFKRVKQVKIIIDGDAEAKKTEVSWLFDLAKQLNGKLQIRQASERLLHWLIVDGKHFRLEKPHITGEIGVNNLFVCNVEPPAISEILMRKFDKWWLAARPVDP